MSEKRYYRPSSADRWMNCPASELLIMGTKAESPDNEAAKRGRAIHDELFHKVPPLLRGESVVMSEAASAIYKEILPYITDKSYASVERPMTSLLQLPSGAFIELSGTIDLLISERATFAASAVLVIIDYKTGCKKCYADSYQLKLYSLLASKAFYKNKEIKSVILQPSIGWKDEYTVTAEELKNLEKEFLEKVYNPTFKMGEWCRYCPAQKQCPIYNRKIKQSLCHLADPESLSNEKKIEILKHRKLIEKTLDDIEENVYNNLESGNAMEGVSLAPKKGRRYLNDGKRVRDYLLEKGYTLEEIINFKLKSISDLSNLSKDVKTYILENSEIRSSGSKLKFGEPDNKVFSQSFVNLLNKE